MIDDLHPTEAYDRFVAGLKPEIAIELIKLGSDVSVEQAFDMANRIGTILEDNGGYNSVAKNTNLKKQSNFQQKPLETPFFNKSTKPSFIPQHNHQKENYRKNYGAPMDIDSMISQISANVKNNISTKSQKVQNKSLTDAQRIFLQNNNGCFYCRKILVDHQSHNCPDKQSKAELNVIVKNDSDGPDIETDSFDDEEENDWKINKQSKYYSYLSNINCSNDFLTRVASILTINNTRQPSNYLLPKRNLLSLVFSVHDFYSWWFQVNL